MKLLRVTAVAVLAAAPVLLPQTAAPPYSLPVFGEANRWNHFEPRLTLVYRTGFEQPSNDWRLSGGASLTRDPSEVLAGGVSVKLIGDAEFVMFPPETLRLEPGRTYMVEYDYRILRQDNSHGFTIVAFRPVAGPIEGTKESLTGAGQRGMPVPVGTDVRAMRMPLAGDVTVGIESLEAVLIVDEIRIHRLDVDIHPARVPLLESGFPRLSNYMLTSPHTLGYLKQFPRERMELEAALTDVLIGPISDHTSEALEYAYRLRKINPKLRILPYQQTFMTQYLDQVPIWGTARTIALYNRTLAPEWFLRDLSGTQIVSPPFPQNVQMDHSPFCPKVNGVNYNTHLVNYLSWSILPSGLFDGIQFDQPEWFLNPLLADGTGKFPEFDINRDGRPDTRAEIDAYWKAGFEELFFRARDRLGPGRILFGNAGHISVNRPMLEFLNGWLRETLSPYDHTPAGDWITDEASGWYTIHRAYQTAMRSVRAPSVIALEYTGQGLGVPVDELTENGVPDRRPEIEKRDLRRMRLGLTSTLLGDGFFEYDFIDNTSPTVWFDEYAVDAAGGPSKTLAARGYLGQPLGDAEEIPTAGRIVAELDFESIPANDNLIIAPGARVTSDPAEVVSGSRSLTIRVNDLSENSLLVATNQNFQFTPNRVYQFLLDYKVLDYKPVRFAGLASVGFFRPGQPLTIGRFDSQFLPDLAGPGQIGSLRAVVKAREGVPLTGVASLLDPGALSIDNVKLIEGGPGVWRRDFENGVALVNPTPEPISVSLADIRGPRNRTGLRRIRGVQAPEWNTGEAVTGAIEIPPADGIVLLADRVPAPTLGPVPGLAVTATGTEAVVRWQPSGGYAAGYLIRHGEAPNEPVMQEAVTRHQSSLTLRGLTPGTRYTVQVAAYDYLGRLGPFTPAASVSTQGSAPRRPAFELVDPALRPRGPASVTGSGLATAAESAAAGPLPWSLGGTLVLVNGTPAQLRSVAPDRIEFVSPEIAGTYAIVHVVSNGVLSGERIARVEPAAR